MNHIPLKKLKKNKKISLIFVVSVLNSSSQNCQDVEFDETYNVNSSQYLH